MIGPALLVARNLPWRYLGPAIGAALALWAAYSWAHDRGKASRDNEVALLIRERDAATCNIAALQSAIMARNDAIALQAARTANAQRAAADAGKVAAKRGKALAGLQARLAADAVAVPDACVTPGAVHEAWGVKAATP